MGAYLAVFIGGGLGSCARLALSAAIVHKTGTGFPWGTLGVNLLGAFLIGILTEFLALKYNLPSIFRLFLVTGFLGGFTTFSAFSLETSLMLQRGDYALAGVYIGFSVIGTVALVFAATQGLRAMM